MAKLNQLLSVFKTTKANVTRDITNSYQDLGKTALFNGMNRVYVPLDDDGEQLAPEHVRVQRQVPVTLLQARGQWTRLFDLTATIDTTNRYATAPVVINGTAVTEPLPATHLLFLEKQLTDIRSFVSKLPTLDPATSWHADEATGLWATEELSSVRQKKVLKALIGAPATDKHPAQVQYYNEDVPAGNWKTRKLSGAIPVTKVANILAKVDIALAAVKQAREAANMTDARDAQSSPILDYIFS